jgi:uncharacterized protein with GYD domain
LGDAGERRVDAQLRLPVRLGGSGGKSAADSVERVQSSFEMAQIKYGVTLERIYWTVGAHDLVAVLGAPDVESVSAFLLDLAAAGNVRSTTMWAFDRDEKSPGETTG